MTTTGGPLPPASDPREWAVPRGSPLFCCAPETHPDFPFPPPRDLWTRERQLEGIPTDWRTAQATADALHPLARPLIPSHRRREAHRVSIAVLAVHKIAKQHGLGNDFIDATIDHIKGRCKVDRGSQNRARLCRYLLPRVFVFSEASPRFVLGAWYFLRSSYSHPQPKHIVVQVVAFKKIYTKTPTVVLQQLVQDYATRPPCIGEVDTYLSKPFELNLIRHRSTRNCSCCGSDALHEKVFLGNSPQLRKKMEICAHARFESGECVWE
jgi:hypothetical protein